MRRCYFVYEKNHISTEQLDSWIKETDIPISLYEVANKIGVKAALKLLKTYQGKRVYISKNCSQKNKMSVVLSELELKGLAELLGGTRLDLRKTSVKSVYNSAYGTMLRKKYSESNLSIGQFCLENNLNYDYYSKKLKKSN